MTGRSQQELELIVELQAIELQRQVRDNRQLNQRVDRLLDELARFQEMQRQEQILREKEQALRHQTQKTINDLLAKVALPAPRGFGDAEYHTDREADDRTICPVLIESRDDPPNSPMHPDHAHSLAQPPAQRAPQEQGEPAQSEPAHPDIPEFLKGDAGTSPPGEEAVAARHPVGGSRGQVAAMRAYHVAPPGPESRNGARPSGVFGLWSDIFSIGQ